MNGAGDVLVLLLAGGVGSRLNVLVHSRAKPAVPFAGIYRIIDFSLSNIMNAGIRQVGVLTQYKPLSLMRHIGTGEPWDFSGRSRGVKILPPRTGFKDSDWYQGTADAVRQNMDFIRAHPSSEVVILSGDHIYQMDLLAMLESHRARNADVTVAMMRVKGEQIKEFGTGITDSLGRIVEWEEKPQQPRTDLASMGIYIFSTAYMDRLLAEDKKEVDFGMHIIPRAIGRDRVFAFPFSGYWRDVGTIEAYWQATMDMLRPDSGLAPERWGILPNPESSQRLADRCPARFYASSCVKNSMIAAGCRIEGTVENSVLSPGVVVRAGARVVDSILFDDCVVEAGATVDLAILDKRVHVGAGATVGVGDKAVPSEQYPKHLASGITLLGKMAAVPPAATVGRNCIIFPAIRTGEYPSLTVADGQTVHYLHD